MLSVCTAMTSVCFQLVGYRWCGDRGPPPSRVALHPAAPGACPWRRLTSPGAFTPWAPPSLVYHPLRWAPVHPQAVCYPPALPRVKQGPREEGEGGKGEFSICIFVREIEACRSGLVCPCPCRAYSVIIFCSQQLWKSVSQSRLRPMVLTDKQMPITTMLCTWTTWLLYWFGLVCIEEVFYHAYLELQVLLPQR